jgi:fibronectin-binding autotransporter adhesin
LDASGPGAASFEFIYDTDYCSGGTITADIGASDTVLVDNTDPAAHQLLIGTNPITNNGTLTLEGGPGDKYLIAGQGKTITNAGTLNFQGSGRSELQTGLVNTGTINIAGGETVTGDGAITQNGGSFTTAGTIDALAGATLSGGTIADSGTFDSIGFTHNGGDTTGNPLLTCGQVYFADSAGGTGSFVVDPSLPNCPGAGINTDIGAGDAVEIHTGAQQADVYTPTDFINHGRLTVDTGQALIQLHGNGITNATDGTLTLGSGSGGSGITLAEGPQTNYGTMSVAAPATVGDNNTLTQAGGTLDIAGALYGTGTQTVTGGLASVKGNWNVANGVSLSGGTLLGTGTITGDVTNGATVSPGSLTGVGKLTVSGSYTQQPAGTLTARVAAAGNDLLSVGGTANLGGTLAVNGDGFNPAPGQTFTVLTDTAQAGQFGTVTGQGYTPAYDATDVKLVPTQVTASPTSLSYGTIAAPLLLGGTSTAQTMTLKDNGQTPVDVGSVTIAGANKGAFSVTQDGCANQTLQPGHSCTVSVTFSPQAVGSATATLAISDSAVGSPQQVALSGVGGQPEVTLNPPRCPSALPRRDRQRPDAHRGRSVIM